MPTRDEVARAICDAWGFAWEPGLQGGDRYAADDCAETGERPTRQHFYAAADAAMALFTPPGVAETQGGRRHRFQAHHRFAWFCTVCGYGPGETLRHLPEMRALSSHGPIFDGDS
ncbi:hypothetical protein [Methylobacterium dankookense]|uniref:Uncharacterized protein n=1 Tax=Methylobacterium dankookense TaxID=560405 RepID=A0A564FV74_9HYPH|nr:hypothetical protein [Methylobacterium dankookense]GJD56728.1 hypothetical protein IFDJLNFL_2625 [Methylobacterium dankookense]VUF11764.1 hypothetical protein MTDSW087_01448 [Methylobacterium dankookense]